MSSVLSVDAAQGVGAGAFGSFQGDVDAEHPLHAFAQFGQRHRPLLDGGTELDGPQHGPARFKLGKDHPTTVETAVPEWKPTEFWNLDSTVRGAELVGKLHMCQPADGG